MKTGSTAVTVALGTLLQRHDEAFLKCTLWPCGEYATELCLQRKPKIHLIDHIAMGVDTTHCLRRMGFYSVTSIRDPAERWNSAYKYNRWKKGNDYGISHNATYDDFMMKMPNCALLRYYDLGSSTCRGGTDDPEFQKRVQNIVTRFDEIIDLYGEAVTDLHKRLMPFLAQENVSEKKSVGNVPRDRMVYEQVLYEALVMRRFELAANPDPKRRLCKEPRVPK
ncbi:unnamed protein product [Chondrus crispus]|uniref:Sulfotransferase domain-containing protein n=1 Tax=Chondrus crispus TaxID=2769 RepID=R7Q6M7_CHOCR|nr:unnamed protein product [Chondrus crispus]CDF33016.1 unnamed protein product [Chondrus crispus]|eukprot:XP_005712819.1 unnamed protein product [Chondrus crispus]